MKHIINMFIEINKVLKYSNKIRKHTFKKLCDKWNIHIVSINRISIDIIIQM